MKKYNLKHDNMNEFQIQNTYIYPIYPRNSKMYSKERFVNINNGSLSGLHWVCFIVKYNESYYFDSFGGQPDKFLPKQLPKPITYHI